MLRVGDWRVDPASSQISRGEEAIRLDVRTMRLLLCMAERPGEVVSIDDLLNHVWAGVTVAPDSVYQAVATLRRHLGDDSKRPAYIATVPRLGYRLVAAVSPWVDSKTPTASAPRLKHGRKWAIGAAVACLALAAVLLWLRGNRENSHSSVAVLPFLDLTEAMNEEPFADGMTEELIDKLSKIRGLRVPSPTSSFYFKDKKLPVADIAKKLGVGYVLDGSVRKSGSRLRVAARLIRADNGFVMWSESYDRPFGDILKVQDDIAGEVTKALRASIAVR